MFDVLRLLLDRLERQAEDLGCERGITSREIASLNERLDEAERRQQNAPSPLMVAHLIGCMAERRKIDAIKIYRSLTGDGLKESKDKIETVMSLFREPTF
ncbi:MAG TPA: hypothetical protein VKT73_12850 [Xanthobacteraceae bacterium]|nr:hypothetical protein [Xanthobacteraceae bacterium]